MNQRRQRGAILIISLMFLVVLTMLALYRLFLYGVNRGRAVPMPERIG